MIDAAVDAVLSLPPGGLVIVAGSRPGVGVTTVARALCAELPMENPANLMSLLPVTDADGKPVKRAPITILDVGVVGEWAPEDRPSRPADLVLLVVHEGCMPGQVHRLAQQLVADYQAETILIKHRQPAPLGVAGLNIKTN